MVGAEAASVLSPSAGAKASTAFTVGVKSAGVRFSTVINSKLSSLTRDNNADSKSAFTIKFEPSGDQRITRVAACGGKVGAIVSTAAADGL